MLKNVFCPNTNTRLLWVTFLGKTTCLRQLQAHRLQTVRFDVINKTQPNAFDPYRREPYIEQDTIVDNLRLRDIDTGKVYDVPKDHAVVFNHENKTLVAIGPVDQLSRIYPDTPNPTTESSLHGPDAFTITTCLPSPVDGTL